MMVVPSLVEEAMAVNTCFALYTYHTLLTSRSAAIEAFQQPAILSLVFMLGGACMLSYYAFGGALLTPVLVNAIPVTMWLSFFGGERVLSEEVVTPE